MSDEKKPETTFMDVLKELRIKTVEELTEDEMAFLKARRSYLTVDERKYFELEEQAPAPKAPQAMNKAELAALLTESGIGFSPDATKAQMLELLEAAQQQQ